MGILDDLKYRREANKEFKEQVALAQLDVSRHSAAEQQAKEKVEKLLELRAGRKDEAYFRGWNSDYLMSLQANPDAFDRALAEARQDCVRWQQRRERAEKELAFLRPNTREDVAERRDAFVNFAKEVLAVDPEGSLDLRFPSTSLAVTRDIIRSGGLISSVDRLDGFLETTNLSDEISVSEIQNIQYSINYWTDIEGYQGCRPCGCMFVLQPRTQEEADMIPGRQMHYVLFHVHPEQLVAIVTTSENVGSVQEWLRENGLPQNIVYRFDAFPLVLEGKKAELAPFYKGTGLEYVEKLGVGGGESVDYVEQPKVDNLIAKATHSCEEMNNQVVAKNDVEIEKE